MARRKLTLALEPIVAALAGGPEDDVGTAILDATEQLLRDHGLARWSVDDVADVAGLGRTTVYRRFPSRDDLVHGVLARELRRTIAAIGVAVAGQADLEDKAVEGTLVALAALEGSVVDRLLHTDPNTVLPFLTTGAGPLIEQARRAFVPGLLSLGLASDPAQAEVAAEALARLGLSFVLTRSTALPLDDPAALRRAVRALLAPVIGS
jgi:AcrR family transcriptional regulator